LAAAAIVAANHVDELRGWFELHAANSPAERKVLEEVAACQRQRHWFAACALLTDDRS